MFKYLYQVFWKKQITPLMQRLRYSLKCFLVLPFGISSIKACYYIAIGQRSKSLIEAKLLIKDHPRTWMPYKLLIKEYYKDSDKIASIHLVHHFLDRLSNSTGEHFNNKKLAKQIINSFFLCLYDSRDFADLIFLKSDNRNKPINFCLHVSYIGRFSNFIIQLSNAITIASMYSIKDIYIQDSEVLSQIFFSFKSILLDQLKIQLHFGRPSTGLVLNSLFFHVRRKNVAEFRKLPIKQLIQYIKPYTHYSACYLPIDSVQDNILPKTLTIHIRSGDIFASKDVHGDYGQPPLSYYIFAVKHFAPKRVVLVYENELNPVIEPLQKFLQSNNIRFRMQSLTLSEDIKTLSSCTSLVVSRGTFALGPIGLSQSLEKIYCFCASLENDPYFTLHLSKDFHKTNVSTAPPTILDIVDKTGSYFQNVCSSNWTNSDEQRDLMVNYSMDNLHLVNRL